MREMRENPQLCIDFEDVWPNQCPEIGPRDAHQEHQPMRQNWALHVNWNPGIHCNFTNKSQDIFIFQTRN